MGFFPNELFKRGERDWLYQQIWEAWKKGELKSGGAAAGETIPDAMELDPRAMREISISVRLDKLVLESLIGGKIRLNPLQTTYEGESVSIIRFLNKEVVLSALTVFKAG